MEHLVAQSVLPLVVLVVQVPQVHNLLQHHVFLVLKVIMHQQLVQEIACHVQLVDSRVLLVPQAVQLVAQVLLAMYWLQAVVYHVHKAIIRKQLVQLFACRA